MEKKKTKTSTTVKDRYNLKTYDRINLRVRKDSRLLERIDDACTSINQSRQAYIIQAIEDRLDKEYLPRPTNTDENT